MVYLTTGIFVLFDFFTGLVKAFKEKSFTSSIMREGLFHKCGSLMLVAFGIFVDYAQTLIDLGANIPIATTICGYIILMEIGSIIENIGEINPQIVPEKIKVHFSKLSDKE